MIAPLREPSERTRRRGAGDQLDLARRLVAATLLSRSDEDRAPRVPGWQAWLFAAWMLFAAVAYALSMAGWSWF